MTTISNLRPDLFNEDQLNDVLELGKATLIKEVIEPIENGMDRLRRTLSELQLLPGVDRVIMRISTLNQLFDSSRKSMGKAEYVNMLNNTGIMIGGSFAEDFIRFLKENQRLPQNESVLLKLWTKIESNANWGNFSISQTKSEMLIIKVKDSFLTRGLDSDKHCNCAFMKGYIIGFLWEAIKQYYYWFSNVITKPAAPMLQPVEISEKELNEVCIFTIQRAQSKLVNAIEMIEKARDVFRSNNYMQSAAYLRTSIEFAFKEKIGIEITEPISLTKIIKAYKKSGAQLRYTIIDKIFARSSSVIHGVKNIEKIECEQMIREVNDIIRSIYFIKLSTKKKKVIEEELISK